MAMRITGMNSGLDTEKIISELMKVQNTKVDTIKKQQTSHLWKQDAWKALNTKALKLYNGTLSSMRFSDAYTKKTTKVSNTSAVSVVTGEKAVSGVQELSINQLAKTGYLTGAKISMAGGKKVGTNTTLSDITGIAADKEVRLSVTAGGKTSAISLKGSSKVSDVVTQLKNAGVNANFDVANQRMFISAKNSGLTSDFTLTAGNEEGFKTLSDLGINLYDDNAAKSYADIASMSSEDKKAWIIREMTARNKTIQSQVDAITKDNKFTGMSVSQLRDLKNKLANFGSDVASYRQLLVNKYNATQEDVDKLTDDQVLAAIKQGDTGRITELKNTLKTDPDNQAAKDELDEINSRITTVSDYQTNRKSLADNTDWIKMNYSLANSKLYVLSSKIASYSKVLEDSYGMPPTEVAAMDYETLMAKVKEKDTAKKTSLENEVKAKPNDQSLKDELAKVKGRLATITDYEKSLVDFGDNVNKAMELGIDLSATENIHADKTQYVEERIAYANIATNLVSGNPTKDELKAAGYTTDDITRIVGRDAEITLNGAKFTSSKNNIEVNGLTFTISQETAPGETITVTTQEDTDGIFDMIKGFIKEYNEIINEMDKLYNAPSARDYQPLTDEEKEAMSESEIEKWETTIKDSVLRRDFTLSTFSSAIKSVMNDSVEVGGKKMYLNNFGIEPLSWFLAGDNEKNAFHISGDKEDNSVANKDDLLKSMIASDPDTVTAFFSGLSKNLYDKMNKILMKRVPGMKDSTAFYDNLSMKSEYNAYTNKIAKQEEKVLAMENKYYMQFSRMETALAKLQSNQSAIAGLLGG